MRPLERPQEHDPAAPRPRSIKPSHESLNKWPVMRHRHLADVLGRFRVTCLVDFIPVGRFSPSSIEQRNTL
ncbi:hypothetical protein MUK42_33361 [Musa troglodytarum]|uniref:Uncharacterized protein n=1 Tax=Musa troglodytarum TaxID=320322 RepID=A0A9E7FCM6_9LILI|nr:hypothetical protein MUK42_33361 [Musa troglodytarum]